MGDFGEFWELRWSHVGTQINQKSMPIAKIDFLENHRFSLGKTNIFKVRGVQVGSKNRSKIDQKIESKTDCILASIFERFWWILGAKLGPSWRQVRLKNRWKINPKWLGRFHIALGTLQEAPERESLIFHWFWKVLGGGGSTHAPSPRVDCPTP